MSERLIKRIGQGTVAETRTHRDELTIRGLLSILSRRRAIIVWSIGICLLLGIITSFFRAPRYKAMGEIEIQKSATDGLGLENLTNPVQDDRSDALDASLTLQTQAKILQSNGIAIKVIKDLNLESTRDFKPTFSPIGWVLGLLTPRGQSDSPTAGLEDAPHRRDHAIKVFEKHLKITPQTGTRIIDIQYTNSDPKVAASVVSDVAKSLVDYRLNSRYEATTEVSGWLTGQLADIKKQAEQQQGKVEELQRESGVYSLGVSDAQGKEIAYSATLDRLQQATQAFSNATANRVLKGALYKSVQNGDPELISGLAGSSLAGSSSGVSNSFLLIQNLRAQQATLESQLAADSSKYGSANSKLSDERAALDSINNQIKSEVSRIGQRAANDYAASQIFEDKMRGVYDEERKAADGQNDKAIALLIARQEAGDSRALYQTLYSHLKQAGVIEGLRSSNISIVDGGRVPSRPAPDNLSALALSLICGCFIGVAGALFVEATNERIDAIAEIEDTLHAQVLAVLPMTNKNVSPAALAAKDRQRLTIGNQGSFTGRVAVLDGPNTAYVEALRGLRTSLLFSQDRPTPKKILITSVAEREGKSSLSLNLAAALVLNGSRVLLVDADMRSAGLSGYMGYERNSRGSTRAETGGLSGALSDFGEPAIQTPFPQLPELFALPAGPVPTYPAELLGSQRMESLAKAWSAKYDYVLIDSPPVLAVTDAQILARLADTTLLVVRHGQTTQKGMERAYHTLHDIEDRNVGIVVNGVHRNSTSFREYYGYRGKTYYSEA